MLNSGTITSERSQTVGACDPKIRLRFVMLMLSGLNHRRVLPLGDVLAIDKHMCLISRPNLQSNEFIIIVGCTDPRITFIYHSKIIKI